MGHDFVYITKLREKGIFFFKIKNKKSTTTLMKSIWSCTWAFLWLSYFLGCEINLSTNVHKIMPMGGSHSIVMFSFTWEILPTKVRLKMND
jgi:hypothetical protein